jgi:peptidoglycan/LPS O-acetylase OafA/YrhL
MSSTAMSAGPRPNHAVGSSPRLNDLEGYRGLAAVGIVVFHAFQFARGNASAGYAYPHTIAQAVLRNLDGLVSMFLILSGYLLYLPVARNFLRGAKAGVVKVFLLRRATRILPLYWSAVMLVWAYRNPTLPGDWRDLVEHLTFTQVFDSKRIFYTIGPAWSLSVEVFFYLFLAAGYTALNRLARHVSSTRDRRLLLLTLPALLTVVSLAWQGWALFVAHEPATRWAIWFNPVARADMFAVGMVIAVMHASRTSSVPLSRVLLYTLRIAALGLLAYGCAVRTDDPTRTSVFNLVSALAFGLLIASSVFDDPDHLWRRALAGPRLAWLGVTSYSLYLWHEPVLLFLDTHLHIDHAPHAFPLVAAILLAASLPVGWLSYRVIERPFGRLSLLVDSAGRRRDYYPPSTGPLETVPGPKPSALRP